MTLWSPPEQREPSPPWLRVLDWLLPCKKCGRRFIRKPLRPDRLALGVRECEDCFLSGIVKRRIEPYINQTRP